MNKSPIIAALTGSVGSGKSTVSEIFASKQVPIISADALAREAICPGSLAIKKLVELYGEAIILPTGELDRQKMREMAFREPSVRKNLEDIIHPVVRALFCVELKKLAEATTPPQLIIYDVPLWFEGKESYPEVSSVIVVSAPRDTCLKRISKRDGISLELAAKMHDSQIPIEKKEAMASYVIRNHGTIAELEAQTLGVYKELMSRRTTANCPKGDEK